MTPALYQQLMQDLDLASRYRTMFIPACSFQILAERDEADQREEDRGGDRTR